ncbi:hypothetical protein [Chryseobacterium fistulae]|uniref:Uncharacterized protein n=1 Tax=Chryseobacterium fistulae TaxID=2675058 RepID=A0A6N4XIK8_9FLAO|nr:hypothetical protein [Chryseobacterium fistulae]CAA7385718.1 hypothetical protein CHRY9393_00003 [Chryseobacterium fistulae]
MDILMNEYNSNFNDLKKLIILMELVPDFSKSQFEILTEKILKLLESGAYSEKIKKIIENELIVNYGLYSDEFDAPTITNNIMKWWMDNNQKPLA